MNKGRLFIFSGPSGSGKDTILKEILQRSPTTMLSISSITRGMRPGEVEGEKYHFISREEFEDLIKNDELLEYNVFVGNYYGTPKKPVFDALEKGIDVILEVDVNGAKKVMEKMPDAISIFMLPPSMAALRRRLINRATDDMSVIEKRLIEAEREISSADIYDYIFVNDDLSAAVNDMLSILKSERLRNDRNKHLINEVLNNA